ncbi:MAG: nucleotidyltransferase, partial [Deltaproteobacteria bacterium]|nr:nucleotidyltransferase [Deltaproteobacteria bacterium]
MRNKSQIKKTLLEQKDTLLAEYGVREIGLFGSLAKGIASPTSD